jgi:hypothetical protein
MEAGMKAATVRHRFRRGEEVVARLEDAEAHNLERGTVVERACLPSWTIGVVLDCRVRGDRATYTLRIEHDGCACICKLDEDAIDGLA